MIKEKQITIYEALEVLAKEWIRTSPAYYVHDCSDSMQTQKATNDMLVLMSKKFGAPTTMVNFVKAYMKDEYVKTYKQYMDEMGEEFDERDFISPLPIKITQKDLDTA